MRITNLELFYRYALPCGELGAELGLLDGEKVRRARRAFLNGIYPERPEEVFPVAVKLLEVTARKIGKEVIDEEVLHRYFWYFHDQHVQEKALLVKGFPVRECMVWPGKMVSASRAETPFGKTKVKKDLLPKLSPGDLITIHHGRACEKINEEQFEKFWNEERCLK